MCTLKIDNGHDKYYKLNINKYLRYFIFKDDVLDEIPTVKLH